MTDLRDQVAAAARRLAREGLVLGTSGNVSARDGERVAVTPTGARLEQLAPEQISVVALADGAQLEGPLKPTSELALHLGVYRRYGSQAVVHTHSPMATAVACATEKELPCVHYAMLALGGAIRIAPYATFGTEELANSVLDALEGKAAALMASHGAVTHAADIDTATEHALLLEWAATVYINASRIGSPRILDPKEQEAVIHAALARGYGETKPA